MSQQGNVAAQNTMGHAVNDGNYEALRQAFTANVNDHDPEPGQQPGPEGFVEFFRGLRGAFPDLEVAIDHMVANADNVAIAYTITGTHMGTFQGIAATGKRIQARGMQIARFEEGKIAERWGSSDELGILKQLGAVVEAGAGMRKAS